MTTTCRTWRGSDGPRWTCGGDEKKGMKGATGRRDFTGTQVEPREGTPGFVAFGNLLMACLILFHASPV